MIVLTPDLCSLSYFHVYKVVGVSFAGCISFFLKYPLKMK